MEGQTDRLSRVTSQEAVQLTLSNQHVTITTTFKTSGLKIEKGKFSNAPKKIYKWDDLFFSWDSLHAKLNNRDMAWSYKKQKHKKIKTYKKSL